MIPDAKLKSFFALLLEDVKAELLEPDEKLADELHSDVLEICDEIETTPAEGLEGLAIKLAIFAWCTEHDDEASRQALSAYQDCARLIGRDPFEELRATVTAANDARAAKARQGEPVNKLFPFGA